MAKRTTKANKRTPIQLAKDKLRTKLTAKFKETLKAKLAARDAVWRERLKVVKMNAGEKRERAKERLAATKERKRLRFWAKKEANGCAGVSQGRHHWH